MAITCTKKEKTMKKIFMLMMAAVMMTACSKDVLDETAGAGDNQKAANSVLQVTTRSGGEATISYPVQVYVFQGDDCKAVQTIGDAGQTLNIALTEGTYSVYAVGGASSDDYTLPAKEDASTTSAMMLKEGKVMTNLMAASATVTLVEGGTNTVTLGLQRKVMLLQDVTINKVPSAATAVSVTIAPLWTALNVGGTYSTAGASTTIALTKQSDNRTWTASANAYLLPPSSQPASVSVNITIGGTTKTYTYSTSDQLEAGYKINIEGTYTEALGVNLTGTITGAEWLGERTITFDFDEGNGNNTNANSANIPAAGTIYQTCYVLSVTDNGDDADVVLLSPSEVTIGDSYDNITMLALTDEARAAAVAAAVDAKIALADVDAISDWRLPSLSELNAIYAAREGINAAFETYVDADAKYLFTDGTAVKYRVLSATGAGAADFGATARVRPVVTVTIAKE